MTISKIRVLIDEIRIVINETERNMRQYIVAIITILAPQLCQAQNILTEAGNWPYTPAVHSRLVADNNGSADTTGEHLVWNFSSLADNAERRQTVRVDTASCWEVTVTEDRGIGRYILRNDSLLLMREESPLSQTAYTRPKLVMRFPLAYGDSIGSDYEAYGTYCGDHAFHTVGTLHTEADATGTLILWGDTLRDTLRLHSTDLSTTRMDIDATALGTIPGRRQTEEHYYWFARGYRYPVVETVERTTHDGTSPVSSFRATYILPPNQQTILYDPVNEDIRHADSLSTLREDIIHYKAAADGGTLTVTYSLDAAAEVKALVCDAMGVVYKERTQNQPAGNGFTLTIDCGNLRHGQYILYLNVNELVYSEKINL